MSRAPSLKGARFTGADGAVFTATSNSAGNYSFEARSTDLVTPYTARLLVDGVEVNAMIGDQTDANCANCHTREGTNSAPGRVRIP
jgi:hypothetical protein